MHEKTSKVSSTGVVLAICSSQGSTEEVKVPPLTLDSESLVTDKKQIPKIGRGSIFKNPTSNCFLPEKKSSAVNVNDKAAFARILAEANAQYSERKQNAKAALGEKFDRYINIAEKQIELLSNQQDLSTAEEQELSGLEHIIDEFVKSQEEDPACDFVL